MGHTSLSCISVAVETGEIWLTCWDSFGFGFIFLGVVLFFKNSCSFLRFPSQTPFPAAACGCSGLRPGCCRAVCAAEASSCGLRLTRMEPRRDRQVLSERGRRASALPVALRMLSGRPSRAMRPLGVEGFVGSGASTSSAPSFPESPSYAFMAVQPRVPKGSEPQASEHMFSSFSPSVRPPLGA